MKVTLLILLAIVGLQCVRCIGSSDEPTTFGTCGTAPLLRRGKVNQRLRFGQVVTNTFECTAPVGVVCVIVRNNKLFRGATATSTAVGAAVTTVTVTLTSERSAGIKSTVECYGT